MEILISIVGKIMEYTVEPVGRQLGYLCFINNNIKKLHSQVEMLKKTKETVQRMVSNARRNVEDIRPDVQSWLTKVDAIIEKSDKILTNEEGQQVRLCLNLVQQHQLSRNAVKMAEEVVGLKNEGNFDTVSYPYAPLWVPSPTNKSDFFNFESRNSTVEQIMDVLLDDNINKIGVHGMGGVGKTMLAKEISRRVVEKKLFDEVVISTISQTPDLKSIQVQLAEKLDLKFEQETVEGRALKLRKRLKMEERILVVLDDIWEHIDLETIGIPSVANHKGCKILLTSRDKHILSNDMCTDRDFEIKVLEEHEAFLLFKKMAGETVETSDFKPITIEIVKECAHLPIAITTVAKALRSKSTLIWRDALNQLRNPVVGNIRGMNKKVYSSLKLSYEQLECQEAKLLFLLCSMFPEDFLIDVEMLHIYAMGMDFLQGVDTVAQGRHRIRKLVDDLVSSSLLQYANEYGYEYSFEKMHIVRGNSYVKMHDIVRDVAILIAFKDDQIHTLSYVKRYLNEWEEEKLSGNYTAVYLDVKGLHNPLQKLMLPKVQLLILGGSEILLNTQELSQTFFDEMKELKVLELRWVKILQLPTSLDSFANIRSLHLIYCVLENIDMIGDLNKLEILSLKGSDITKIPTSIRQLTKLKVLDLSRCYQLKEIPPNILSQLTKLEELYLETFNEWEELNEGRKNASVSELKYLWNLSILSVCIQDENIMPKQLFSKELNLENFNITIGTKYVGTVGKQYRKLHLDIDLESSMDDWINMLLKRTQRMELVGSICTRIFFSELDENESSQVKHLCLSHNSELQYFIHEQKKPLRKSLSNLECLTMKNLKNLESVIHGNARESPFNKLRIFKLHKCNKLRSLFFKSILDELLNLEDIKISCCEMVEEIIVIESGETTNKIEFTRLNRLRLHFLPRLQKFSSEIHEFGQSSLDNSEKIRESKFSNDGSLFSEKVSFPNLKELSIGGANNLRMIWHNTLFPISFSKLKRVWINECNNLEKVFPSNIMIMLTCLETLSIWNCKLLERVFELQETDVTTKSDALLPSLRELELFHLPNLEYVWSKHPWELEIFENVQDLTIFECPKLKGALIKVFQRLEYLKIDIGDFKNIIGKERSVQMQEMDQINASKVKTIQLQDGLELFMKLKVLNLFGTSHYKSTHLPMEIVRVLHNLETLDITNTFIEEIIPNERLIDVEDHQNAGSGAVNILVPSLVSFKNLIDLSVDTCYRLTHLFNPSVATTLVQLTRLYIADCKRMTTIIVGRAEEENDEIIFKKLKFITLSRLSKLISFHSGKCIIKFPYLEKLKIENCPEMKVFSLGIVSTPLLHTEKVSLYCDNERFVTKDSEDIIVKDINVIVEQAWEKYYDIDIQYLFTNQNLEEDQLNHSSSQVEELESD